jgi:hypothetical protein
MKIINKKSHLVFLAAMSLILSNCASITTGQNQTLSLDTVPEKGALCKLVNDKGTWFVHSTPGSVVVTRAYGDLHVTCTKDNLAGSVNVKSSTKGMAFGNIIAGGIIGAAVDVGTGSAYDYPSLITVELR